ncbi:hypothetical protein [Streptomyces sp. NPDC048473]|uniref:hypothetical protein n=1 Tax=unclassified Streptomyces TaxID=2593676 RepID=UPI0037196D9D
MSIIVEFFTAPDDTSAALVLQTGPRCAFESLSFGNFDPEEAVAFLSAAALKNSSKLVSLVSSPARTMTGASSSRSQLACPQHSPRLSGRS